ncbi:MAG: tRNA (adenosine(37)-N6)-threonylcarbamoyltransferase complex dimerization subunit type 1 TsaB [Kiritimatiellia bacterium]
MLLAIERSTKAASAALYEVDALPPVGQAVDMVRCRAFLQDEADGSGDAYPLVARLLQQANATPADLTAFAVGVGPGSFSGIRAALALLRGLAAPRHLPVAGVNSAAAAAFAYRAANPAAPRPIRVLGDARHSHIWCFQEPDDPNTLVHTAQDIQLYSRTAAPKDATPLPPVEELEALAQNPAAGTVLLADPARLATLFPNAQPARADANGIAALALAGLYNPNADPIYLHPAVFGAPSP